MMPTDAEQVIDLIFGRWRSQILAAGTELGIFDRLNRTAPQTASSLAASMGVDSALLYRLLRARPHSACSLRTLRAGSC